MTPDILPDSRARNRERGRVFRGSQAWLPVYCANCHKDAGWCPETTTYLFYLCDNCVGTYGEIAGTMLVPDEVHFRRCREAQMNEYGRELTPLELAKTLEEEGASPLAKLLTLGQ